MDDVLASIRRIVIEEERAEDAGSAGGTDTSERQDQGEQAEPIPLPTAFQRPEEDETRAPAPPVAVAATDSGAGDTDPTGDDAGDAGEAAAPEPGGEFVLTSSMLARPGDEPAALPNPVEEAAGDPAPVEDATAASEPATLDEEQLTELVRGIVRTELTGSYGATLSRNIQRLVRDEVRKALAERG